jgi:hypothetical protein
MFTRLVTKIRKIKLAKYETAHFVIGGIEPETQPQKALGEMVTTIRNLVADAVIDPAVGLSEHHPRTIIAMVTTNILVNLLYFSIGRADPRVRLNMVEDTLNEVCDMSLNLWKSLEAANADEKTAH